MMIRVLELKDPDVADILAFLEIASEEDLARVEAFLEGRRALREAMSTVDVGDEVSFPAMASFHPPVVTGKVKEKNRFTVKVLPFGSVHPCHVDPRKLKVVKRKRAKR